MAERQFFATKPRRVFYETLQLDHPAFGTLRFVRNQFAPITLGGSEYLPASFEVAQSPQDGENPVPSIEVQLGRVGLQIKEAVKQIDAFPFGWMIPITATYTSWDGGNISTPLQAPVTLSVGNVTIDRDSVGMSLEDDNPEGVSTARRYTVTDFPGTGASL